MFTKLDYIFIGIFASMCFLIFLFSMSVQNVNKQNTINAKLDSLLQTNNSDTIFVYDKNLINDTLFIIDIYNKEYLIINKKQPGDRR